MKKWILGLSVALMGTALVITEVEARRLGGGRTTGVQRNTIANPPASTPAKPAQQQAGQQQAAPAAGAAAAAAPAASGLSKWMPLLGGLALGGMLGYLFSGSGLGGILLLALLALAAVVAFRMLARRRGQEAPRPMQFAGGLGREMVSPPPSSSMAMQASAPSLPAGFDAAGFLKGAKLNFMRLQAANDRGQIGDIREFTTDEMFSELRKDIDARGAAGQQTDVFGLNADLLELVTEADQHWASVRFSGQVREAPGSAPEDFQEVWHLVKPANGSSGWLLAGIQQMH